MEDPNKVMESAFEVLGCDLEARLYENDGVKTKVFKLQYPDVLEELSDWEFQAHKHTKSFW